MEHKVDTSKEIIMESNPYGDFEFNGAEFNELANEVVEGPTEVDTPEDDLDIETHDGDSEGPENGSESLESEEETAPEEDKAESEENLDDKEVVIEIDGEEVPVKVDELKKGYLRQQDYTKKTMQLSEQRKELETTIENTKNEYQKLAIKVNDELEQYTKLTQADWDRLAETDPQAYAYHDRAYKNALAKSNEVQAKYEAAKRYEEQKEMELRQAKASEANQVLMDILPEWNQDVYNGLLQFAIDEGVSEDILNSTDPHLLRLILEVKEARNAGAKVKEKLKPKKTVKGVRGTKMDHNQKAKTQTANPYNDGADAFMKFI